MLQEQQALNAELTSIKKEEMLAKQKLIAVDSLLLQKKYGSALNRYKQLQQNGFKTDSLGLALRIFVSQQALKLSKGLQSSNNALRDFKESSKQANRALAEADVRQLDSINFVLEQSRVELERLRVKLREKSFGEYLNFKNAKGSQIHYVGEVHNNKANGYGMAVLNTGSRYEGQWQDNQRHGNGVFYWPDGDYYEGEYQNDQRNGQGTYYWTNGEKYMGSWKNDKRSGKGAFYNADGELVTQGTWENDKLVKEYSGT